MTKTAQYQHADKSVRTFVVGALPHESGRFQPFFGEIGGPGLTKTGDQLVSTEERAVLLAQELLKEAMLGLKYRRVPDESRRP